MGKEKNIDKSGIQRGSVINVSTHYLPKQLKEPQKLYEIDDMDKYSDDLDTYNYSNWRVFEIIGRINPKKYSQYPSLYKLLLDVESEGNDEKVLILDKQPTQKLQEAWEKRLDKACDIFDVLFNAIKESKSENDFYNLAQKYRSEIASLLYYNNTDILKTMEGFGELANDHEKGKISDEELDEKLQQFKSWALSRKFATPTCDLIFYMKGSKAEIKDLKNKFLENGSNIYVVQ